MITAARERRPWRVAAPASMPPASLSSPRTAGARLAGGALQRPHVHTEISGNFDVVVLLGPGGARTRSHSSARSPPGSTAGDEPGVGPAEYRFERVVLS